MAKKMTGARKGVAGASRPIGGGLKKPGAMNTVKGISTPFKPLMGGKR